MGEPLYPCFDEQPITWLSYFINGVLSTSFIIFGLVGICYYRHQCRQRKSPASRMSVFLAGLCLWDALLLLSALGMYAGLVLLWGRRPWYGPTVYCHIIFYPAIHISTGGGGWTLVAVTYDRFRAVADPLRTLTRARSKAHLLCFIIFFMALFLNVPSTMKLETHLCKEPLSGKISTTIYFSVLSESPWFKWAYTIGVYTMFMLMLPVALVATMTVRTLMIRREAIDKRKMGLSGWDRIRTQRRILNATTVLSVVAGKYFVCYAMLTTCNFMATLDIGVENEIFQLFEDITNLVVVINSATNWCQLVGLQNISGRQHQRRGISLSERDTRLLRNVWSRADPVQLSKQLLTDFANRTPSPINNRRLRANSIELIVIPSSSIETPTSSQEKPQCKIVECLAQLMSDLPLRSTVDIRENIRNIGLLHYQRNVNLGKTDWFLIRTHMIEHINNTAMCSVSESRAVEKMVTLIIREMKMGQVCQKVSMEMEYKRSSSCRLSHSLSVGSAQTR